MKKTLLCLLGLLLISSINAQEDQKWEPKEIINTQYVGNPLFSHDSKMVIWSKKESLEKEDKFVNHLYLTYLDKDKKDKFRTVQLTRGKESEGNALFGKNNENIYFTSSRDEGKKLWKLSLYGGEPEEVHEFENDISDFKWKDEHTLFFVSSEGKSLYDIKNEKDNTQIIEDTLHWNPKRIYSYDLDSEEIKRITNNDYRVSDYEVSRDGKYLIYRLTLSPDFGVDGNPKPTYFLKNLSTGEETQILKGLQSPGNFKFTANSNGFFFLATKSSNPEWEGAGISELYYYDLSSNNYKKVDLHWENGLEYNYMISGDDVIAQLANGALKKVAAYIKDGDSWKMREFDLGEKAKHVELLEMGENGQKLLYTYSTASKLPEYYVTDLKKGRRNVGLENTKEFVSLNDKLKKKPIAKSEVIYWKGANNDSISGILFYPKNYKKDQKYPLIVSIHGGPTGVDQDSWSESWAYFPQIYTDKGAFVLKPNYHGSGSHSLEFIESIKNGNYYILDQEDIKKGIDFLNEKGMIDMDKLGIKGWSNGAILTTWMTLQYPDMFKVAAPGAGDVNWTSDYGTCQFGVTFDQSYMGGAPWDDTNGKTYNQWYVENSPIFEIEKIKTPTIIFHGSEDRAVPRDQGWEYYRGLQQVGQAPVKFLWFPGQPHGLQKVTHQLRKMKEEIAWIDKYLFEKEENKNEAFKEESPLAAQLIIQKNMNENGYYGSLKNGKLTPEMVSLGKDTISIGRFEVTNAQYQQFKGGELDVLHANEPVTGLSKEEIGNYLNWLNETTGSNYRLPNKKEAEKLSKLAKKNFKGQNNLNYWAGYELNQLDVDDLKKKTAELKSSLIQPVGSHLPVKISEKQIFDIGGNVAEYYKDGDELKVYDFSAYDFVDPYSNENKTPAKYTGFRLVKEKE
ncbi:peptidase S9 [Christiangramia fulva]|uniref:Peptidase S9 n=1 Tax=Christiangramia fulva TaxID=2126553 RepID=A0A2R3Z7D6_9FLAO|nr:prolyl oligopeptidase family serine peptidase [Christiangramia fulva]AVR46122.1 peptidase S9 [Christiangramia fulva]